MSNDFEGVRGLFISRRENAPEFVKVQMGIRVEEFKQYLDAHVKEGGFVNIDILLSKDNKLYAKLDDYQKPEAPTTENNSDDGNTTDDLPF